MSVAGDAVKPVSDRCATCGDAVSPPPLDVPTRLTLAALSTKVVHLEATVERLRGVLREILAWKESPAVQGAFFSAWNHGSRVTQEEADATDAMWDRARSALEEQGRE